MCQQLFKLKAELQLKTWLPFSLSNIPSGINKHEITESLSTQQLHPVWKLLSGNFGGLGDLGSLPLNFGGLVNRLFVRSSVRPAVRPSVRPSVHSFGPSIDHNQTVNRFTNLSGLYFPGVSRQHKHANSGFPRVSTTSQGSFYENLATNLAWSHLSESRAVRLFTLVMGWVRLVSVWSDLGVWKPCAVPQRGLSWDFRCSSEPRELRQ